MFGKPRHSVNSIGFVKNDGLGWLGNNIRKHVDFNFHSKAGKILRRKIDFEQFVNHEYLHEITRDFKHVVNKHIKGTPFNKRSAANEAHDLMTLELQKKINLQKYPQIKKSYAESVVKRSGMIERVEKVVSSNDIKTLTEGWFSNTLSERGPFISEWMIVDKSAIKTVKGLEKMAIEAGNQNLINIIKEINNLKNSYGKVIAEVFG